IHIKKSNNKTLIGNINFADLAGNEKIKDTLVNGERLEEAKKINLSLTILGRVIHALSLNRIPHYRDSKLTLLLKNSLGGNCKSILVLNISSHISNKEQSINTLRFGQLCKNIKNNTKININLNNINNLNEILHYKNEI